MYTNKKNDFLVTSSLEPFSGNIELRMNSLDITVNEKDFETAEKKLCEKISQWYSDAKKEKTPISAEHNLIFDKLSQCTQKSEEIKKLFQIHSVFSPSSSKTWKTEQELYKKYAISRLLINNIYSFVFLLTLLIIIFCSPKNLTGTGYIAVISLSIILVFLSLTVFLSSLIEYYVKRSSFIEIIENSALICFADRNYKIYNVNIINNIEAITVSTSHITILGSIINKTYNNSYKLLKENELKRIVIPRIFSNEESLLDELSIIKEADKNA